MDIRKYFSAKSPEGIEENGMNDNESQTTAEVNADINDQERLNSDSNAIADNRAISFDQGEHIISVVPEKPHQPPVDQIPVQKLANKTLKFQANWYNRFP